MLSGGTVTQNRYNLIFRLFALSPAKQTPQAHRSVSSPFVAFCSLPGSPRACPPLTCSCCAEGKSTPQQLHFLLTCSLPATAPAEGKTTHQQGPPHAEHCQGQRSHPALHLGRRARDTFPSESHAARAGSCVPARPSLVPFCKARLPSWAPCAYSVEALSNGTGLLHVAFYTPCAWRSWQAWRNRGEKSKQAGAKGMSEEQITLPTLWRPGRLRRAAR